MAYLYYTQTGSRHMHCPLSFTGPYMVLEAGAAAEIEGINIIIDQWKKIMHSFCYHVWVKGFACEVCAVSGGV